MHKEDPRDEPIRQNIWREDSMFDRSDTMEDFMEHPPNPKPIVYRQSKRKASMIANLFLLDDDKQTAHRRVKRRAATNYYNVPEAHKREFCENENTEQRVYRVANHKILLFSLKVVAKGKSPDSRSSNE